MKNVEDRYFGVNLFAEKVISVSCEKSRIRITAKDHVVFFETPIFWDHSNPKSQVFGITKTPKNMGS